ncbi:MAG: DUF4331 domain-containing protein [Geminicoccaceae bacterium]
MFSKPPTALLAATTLCLVASGPAWSSSHMDAPLITFDDAANTTDVYAFVSTDAETGIEYLTTALSVYPFEEPGIGPNTFRFDDRVAYEIHVALDDNVARGRSDITYRFTFDTEFVNEDTILQQYLGLIDPNDTDGGFPTNQNLRQSYEVTKFERGRRGRSITLGKGARDGLIVPVNNQGLVTPFYNQGDDGDAPAKEGVTTAAALDPYTTSAIARLPGHYMVFAGQRDDGFYADIQSIFDLDFSFGAATGTPTKPFDSQGGFNVHTIVLNVPLSELGHAQLAGVFATTSRSDDLSSKRRRPRFRQVGRQGNPLFAEALIATGEKDRYNMTLPIRDERLFAEFAEDPELGRVLGVTEIIPGLIRSIFIPDLIKVDLTTGPARLAGQDGFNRLSIFGGDLLQSEFQDPFGNGGLIPGGWPNGRRFGDDVVDIALIALGAGGTDFAAFPSIDFDGITANDITFNQVFPYAATPLNGRNHPSDGDPNSPVDAGDS